ncbi:MAG: hypothetical protein LBS45_05605 [Synergistaceae bacterium]|nr:hypothetical protein [Synergistaceae bacterium]
MESNARIEELFSLVEGLREEIADLREKIAEDRREDSVPDMAKIKSFLEDGFTRVNEALRPVAEKVSDKIGKPARDAVNVIEEKIAAHPFAAVGAAVATGFVIGKAVGFFASGRCLKG